MRSSSCLSTEAFHQFHRIDRCLYEKMVLKLCRDPIESLHVHALFLWLETKGCVNLVDKLLHCPSQLMEIILEEAMLCLSCIHPIPNHTTTTTIPKPNNDHRIPMMQGIVDGKLYGGLHFFYQNRQNAYQEIKTIIDTVCFRALSDIATRAIQQQQQQHRNYTSSSSSSTPQQQQQQHQMKMMMKVWPEGRTLFMTFSKGYPLSKCEVEEFLTQSFGNCVESIHMQQVVPPNEQSLHAHIVLSSPSDLDLILGPDPGAWIQFTIHGKDARVRRFDTEQPAVKSMMKIGQ